MISQYLIKKAVAPNLDPKETALSWRHFLGPAPLAALQGMNRKQQIQANYDAWKKVLGALGGEAVGAGVTGGLGYLIGKAISGDDSGGVIGASIGAIPGMFGGTLLGSYLVHNYIQKKRQLGPDADANFNNVYGLSPSATLALQGLSKAQQDDSDADRAKLMTQGALIPFGDLIGYQKLRDQNLAKSASISLLYGLTKQALSSKLLTAAAKKVGDLIKLNPEYINKYQRLSALLYGRTRAADEIRGARKFSSNGDIINDMLGRASIGQDSHIGGSISAMKYAQLLRDKTNAAVISRHNKALFKDIGSFDELGNRAINANAYRRNAAQGFVPYGILIPKQKFDLYKKYKLGKGGNFLYF